jgi:hypothetical protein
MDPINGKRPVVKPINAELGIAGDRELENCICEPNLGV